MSGIPSYDSFVERPSSLSGGRIEAPQIRDFSGQQAAELGHQMEKSGGVMASVANDMQERANQLRIDDALNQIKEESMRLQHDPKDGFSNLRGQNALQRPDGRPLTEEYSEKLGKRISEVADTLGNDAQKLVFQQHAQSIMGQFRASTMDHESREFQTYGLSVSEGVQSTAMREIGLNWDKPDVVLNAAGRIQAEVYRQAQILGRSAEWSESQARKLTSNAHVTALSAAIENGNYGYAEKYRKRFAGQMDADDLLKVDGVIKHGVDTQVGVQTARDTIASFSHKIVTSDAERAFNILIGTESGGRQFGKNGAPLTSSAGAVGIAQVMPGTGPEAAKLAGLEWDESRYKNDPSYNRALGLAYFQKQLQTNGGDLAKAYASYNAGPGRVQEALEKAATARSEGKDVHWLSLLPKETQDYVSKNMTEFNSGSGANSFPTLKEMDDQLMASNPDFALHPERAKAARTELNHQFEMIKAEKKQQEDDAIANAMRAAEQVSFRYSEIPPSIMRDVPPDKRDSISAYCRNMAKGDDTTSPLLYQKLVSDPEWIKNMSDSEFYGLRRELREEDFRHFTNERAKLKGNGVGVGGAGDLDSGAIKRELDQLMQVYEIDPNPKSSDTDASMRVGSVRMFVNNYLIGRQAEVGKKLNDQEIAKEISGLFAKNVTLRGMFSDTSKSVMTMTVGDIPEEEKDLIKASFEKLGYGKPTDGQILSAYLHKKTTRPKPGPTFRGKVNR